MFKNLVGKPSQYTRFIIPDSLPQRVALPSSTIRCRVSVVQIPKLLRFLLSSLTFIISNTKVSYHSDRNVWPEYNFSPSALPHERNNGSYLVNSCVKISGETWEFCLVYQNRMGSCYICHRKWPWSVCNTYAWGFNLYSRYLHSYSFG